jgi:hypothetical protein
MVTPLTERARRGLAALALAALAMLVAPRACAAPAMWVVTKGDATLYLFGTMHILHPNDPWRTPASTRATRWPARSIPGTWRLWAGSWRTRNYRSDPSSFCGLGASG